MYAVSKLILYVLLLEKVWAVHGLASIGSRNRRKSVRLESKRKRVFMPRSHVASNLQVVSSGRRHRARLGHHRRADYRALHLASLEAPARPSLSLRSQPGRLAERRDEKCYIGIKLYTNIPFLIVDTVANGFLSVAFLLPIWQSKSPQIKRLAQRSSVAALISLLTSL